jgi:hypothetical protein
MHTLKEGDILVCSWGYDQTNIDFYQVTKVVSNISVRIRQIKNRIVSREEQQDLVEPVKGEFKGLEMLKRPDKDNWVRISSFEAARPWEGKPEYQTNSIYGH